MLKKDERNVRITFFLVLVIFFFGLVGYRLFTLAYVNHDYYSGIAEKRKLDSERLNRGDVFISSEDGPVLVATTKKYPVIYLSPRDVEDKHGVSSAVSSVLGLKRSFIDRLLAKENDPFEVLIKRASDEQVKKIEAEKLKGIGISFEEARYYPEKILSHALGFVGFAHNSHLKEGQYGVEGFYDNLLASGEELTNSIILTVDRDIQVFAEGMLSEAVDRWDSDSGTIIVQDPNSGAILAMATSPSYDSNNYSDYPIGRFLNPSVQEAFEPGSSFKPFTISMALDLNKINPQTTYYDPGSLEISGYTVRNFDEKSHGVQTMTQVLEKSLNTGSIYALDQIGYDSFLNYAVSFRFGEETEIDLEGEIAGNLNNLKTVPKNRLNYATASFGQGIAVTPIQMITAYSALANGGKLYRPYIVDTIIDKDGTLRKTKPEVVSAPISEETSKTISKILTGVVDNGFDRARIDGYDVAGKTGTAQIADPDGGYSDDLIHNFIGYAPASDPKFVVFIKLDRPKGVNFASTSLTPVFKEMVKFLLNHFNIPPTR